MFDVWASVAELHQPCLYRPVTDRLLGADGLVRREIMTSIDRLLCEHLAAGRAAFQAPPVPAALRPNERFLNTSAMQKAIRRGDVELAVRCAQQGCLDDPDYTFRRLATCAVEDVGIGNLLAVGMALAVMGNRQMRKRGATDELAAYLAHLLAISPKSRLACDLLSLADYDPTMARARRALSGASDDLLKSLARDRSKSQSERMIAAWLLSGTERFRGMNMPRFRRGREMFVQLIARGRAPLLIYYLADRTAARLSDAMHVSWLLVTDLIDGDPDVELRDNRIAPSPLIRGFPAYAYDLHTGEGRLALNRFSRQCGPVAAALSSTPPQQRDLAIRHAAFLVEGGQLGLRLDTQTTIEIEQRAHWSELAVAGLVDEDAQETLKLAVWENLPQLHKLRRYMSSAL